MKLSDNTIDVLKNYSTINQSLLFRQGNVLRTISPLRTIFVEATVDETFPETFALYDLNKLLAKISLYEDAELDFSTDRLSITTQKKKRSDHIKYCSPQVIVAPDPNKSIIPAAAKCS